MTGMGHPRTAFRATLRLLSVATYPMATHHGPGAESALATDAVVRT